MDSCPVCYESMENVSTVTIPCNHTVCLSCVMMMNRFNINNCPLCRETILSDEHFQEEPQIIPNYDINITDNTDDNYTNINDQNVNIIPFENENIELNDNNINFDLDIINIMSNDIINNIINLDNNTLQSIFNNNNTPQDIIEITNMVSNNNILSNNNTIIL